MRNIAESKVLTQENLGLNTFSRLRVTKKDLIEKYLTVALIVNDHAQ